ncbi:arginine--tRNA ligase [Candidatus Saccharibacteria bacterium]|nr:arginine--tRNA ligase [Candidatus Saccharibacteria bacterium]
MEELRTRLKKVIKNIFGIDFDVTITPAPEGVKADFASNVAMQLAKEVHQAPVVIAKQIAEKMADYEVEIAGPGFLNFTLSDEYFSRKIANFAVDFDKNISCDEYLGKSVITEFSDPNPFKVLHVGHLYTSIVGEAISRLIEFAGANVHRVNFGGDVGLHVAKTMYRMLERKAEMADLMPYQRAEFMAECYVEGTRLYDEAEEAHNRIVELNKEIYEIVANDKHDSELAQIYWTGREWSYAYFDDFYARIGVKFEKYYPESTVAKRGLDTVKEQLNNGVYEESDGAIIYRGEKMGLHTRVFINKEGLPTYEAKDVGLILTKWDDYKFDESVVITGSDIIDYMKVVLSSIKEFRPELVERTDHITHGNVRLPGNEKMSSRKGNFLRAVDVLDMVQDALNAAYDKVDERIVMGAVKYAFLKYRIGGDIIFNVEDSVSMNGNSGPYLQYSCVRAKKILEKCQENEKTVYETGDAVVYVKTLGRKITEYKDVLKGVIDEKAPHKLCNYLYELAQDFSRFYENVKVAGNKDEKELKQLVEVYLKVMTHGLNLLGIEIPEEM